MEIKFLACKKYPVKYDFEYDYEYYCVKTQKELDALDEDLLPIPSIAISMSKILVRNKDFVNFIKKANEKIPSVEIPEDDIDLSALHLPYSSAEPEVFALELWGLLEKENLGQMKLLKQYNIHSDLLENIPFLIKTHALMLHFCRPDIELDFKEGEGIYSHINKEANIHSTLNIKIGLKTSVNNIIAFLKDHKSIIDDYLTQLTDNPWQISKQAFYIYDLREQGKKFREIADIIEDKFYANDEDYAGQINENSVKKSYSRTASTIKDLFSKK